MKNLKPQQERFVVEYLKTPENATDAAIRAGYSPKTATAQASRLLTNVNVRKAIDEAQNETRERVKEEVGLTVDMVVNGLLKEAQDYAEGSTQSARVSAWAHLGKHLGMFKDKIEHSGKIEISDISDDALDKRIQELESKVMQNDKRGEA